MFYLFLLGFLVVYIIAPVPIQILMLIADTFVPDPIPAIDEILMMVILGNRIRKAIAVRNFVVKHKILAALIGITLVCFLYVVISVVVGML